MRVPSQNDFYRVLRVIMDINKVKYYGGVFNAFSKVIFSSVGTAFELRTIGFLWCFAY